jgi:hypothetical protein
MSSAKDLERKSAAVAELALGWGELLAREAYPQGPGTDVSLAEMEEIVAAASKAMVDGAIGKMTKDQATGEKKGVRSHCFATVVSYTLGRPRGRSVDSRLRRRALDSTHVS